MLTELLRTKEEDTGGREQKMLDLPSAKELKAISSMWWWCSELNTYVNKERKDDNKDLDWESSSLDLNLDSKTHFLCVYFLAKLC